MRERQVIFMESGTCPDFSEWGVKHWTGCGLLCEWTKMCQSLSMREEWAPSYVPIHGLDRNKIPKLVLLAQLFLYMFVETEFFPRDITISEHRF